jgi:hypothetical protein
MAGTARVELNRAAAADHFGMKYQVIPNPMFANEK